MLQCPTAADHTGSVSRTVTRRRHADTFRTDDRVVEELPVALVFNGISHAVMMATPIDLDVFALGFALSEGIVERASDVFDIETFCAADSAQVQLTVSQQAFMELKGKRRALAGRSGCGVCGIESIALLDLSPARIDHAGAASDIGADAVERAARELPARQVLMRETGGIHAAAWCSRDGEVLDVFEDVGRHNALDKLIGQLARRKADTRSGFVFLSSRASYELVRKAARMHIPMIATISAPTSLAIDVARQAGIRLLGFCRGEGYVEYVEIRTIYHDHPFYGYRRVHALLVKREYQHNRKKTQRLMRLTELRAIYPRKKTTICNPKHEKCPYLLKDMKITHPNQVWVDRYYVY